MAQRNPQLNMLKKQRSAYGGSLMTTRKGRAHGRPLSTRETMHLVLRSSQAKAHWSFRRQDKKIREIVRKFSERFGVRVLSLANVGNHLHFHIKLSNRHTYRPFIRAMTAAIAMAVTGRNRWTAAGGRGNDGSSKEIDGSARKFWDYRPYTRVVQGFRGFLNLRDYIRINQWEGFGVGRFQAEFLVKGGEFVESS